MFHLKVGLRLFSWTHLDTSVFCWVPYIYLVSFSGIPVNRPTLNSPVTNAEQTRSIYIMFFTFFLHGMKSIFLDP